MMNRREALRTIAVTSAAAWTAGWPGSARAVPPPGEGTFTLPALDFAPDALEPHVDSLTMQIHHGKHHAAYINNLNQALAAYPELAGQSVEQLLVNLKGLPDDLQATVRNQGGGHANHTLFWASLAPHGGEPVGELAEAMAAAFGSFTACRDALTKAALGQFGSGWAWLSVDDDHSLQVESLPNQDNPLLFGRRPLFGLDVWEHAYYLRYQNRRADYVKAIWNVVDWPRISRRYRDMAG